MLRAAAERGQAWATASLAEMMMRKAQDGDRHQHSVSHGLSVPAAVQCMQLICGGAMMLVGRVDVVKGFDSHLPIWAQSVPILDMNLFTR